MTDEELRKLLDGGIIYRDLKPCDLCTFAPTLAAELLKARATIREMALQILSNDGQMMDKIDKLTKENDKLKSLVTDLTDNLDYLINLECVIDTVDMLNLYDISDFIYQSRKITGKE